MPGHVISFGKQCPTQGLSIFRHFCGTRRAEGGGEGRNREGKRGLWQVEFHLGFGRFSQSEEKEERGRDTGKVRTHNLASLDRSAGRGRHGRTGCVAALRSGREIGRVEVSGRHVRCSLYGVPALTVLKRYEIRFRARCGSSVVPIQSTIESTQVRCWRDSLSLACRKPAND